jgi:spore photoproduct lyase
MPQDYSDILEPNTDSIMDRIKSINRLKKLGWEVHLNFSPVIVYNKWVQFYTELFIDIRRIANLDNVKSEVIFLTNHKHSMNIANEEVKEIIQYSSEIKNKSGVMKYPSIQKRKFVETFKNLHDKYLTIPIRYIF